ncbi:hypothetical protein [Sporomusa sp.]|uniref:hypothetical protein n=1 Tax=Sporomusa sp. TaxID=2078658 RepID=UPI002BF8748C|nr:hypothetical protein [Sporomusa sp.]HWR45175.1 hypothetical protein [Sporomusa sp.]
MIARMYSILIALSTMFGIMINTPFAKYALLIIAAIFEFAVIVICIITLLEVIPTELKLRTKIKAANRV